MQMRQLVAEEMTDNYANNFWGKKFPKYRPIISISQLIKAGEITVMQYIYSNYVSRLINILRLHIQEFLQQIQSRLLRGREARMGPELLNIIQGLHDQLELIGQQRLQELAEMFGANVVVFHEDVLQLAEIFFGGQRHQFAKSVAYLAAHRLVVLKLGEFQDLFGCGQRIQQRDPNPHVVGRQQLAVVEMEHGIGGRYSHFEIGARAKHRQQAIHKLFLNQYKCQ